jgi:excisionase family DNA binding protein
MTITDAPMQVEAARAGETTLYRFFNERGRCIYIGITEDARRRFLTHRKTAWWREVADIEKEVFPTREAAAQAERAAIAAESPKYNVVHNSGRQEVVGTAPPRRDYMPINEAAEYVGVCQKTIRRWISTGDLRGYRQGPRLIRVSREDLEAMMQQIPTVRTK